MEKKRFILVAGPFATQEAADETVKALGSQNHSTYAQYKTDAEGFTTHEKEYYVERDIEAQPARLFGMSWGEIQKRQQRR